MNTRVYDYVYIFLTIAFTVYGQLILKWRIKDFGSLPADTFDKLKFLVSLLFDPFILSGFVAGFLAGLAWMAAVSKFQLSHAYPMLSLSFVAVLLLSGWLLGEPVTWPKLVGVAMIVLGTMVASQG